MKSKQIYMHRHMQKYIMYVLKSTNTNSYLERDTSMLMKYTHVHRKLHVVHVRARQAYKWINTNIEFHTHTTSQRRKTWQAEAFPYHLFVIDYYS